MIQLDATEIIHNRCSTKKTFPAYKALVSMKCSTLLLLNYAFTLVCMGRCFSFPITKTIFAPAVSRQNTLAMGFFDFLTGSKPKVEEEVEVQAPTTVKKSQGPPARDVVATKTRFADPVKGDSADAASVRPLLAGTQLEFRPLKTVYRASKDGWNPKAFHKCVDSLGAAVVFATTSDGLFVGGFNPKGWSGGGANRPSIASFVFVRGKGSKPMDAIKLCKVGGGDFAIGNDNQESGIFFGPDALVIPLVAKPYGYPMIENNKMARSRLGSYYEKLPDGGKSIFTFGGSDKKSEFEGTLTDVFVLTGVYSKDEEIPFSTPF